MIRRAHFYKFRHHSTAMSSDTQADARDLHRAQRMEIIFSPITSTPETQRVFRTILRGEYGSMMAIYAIDQDTVGDGGKIVLDDRIAGELSSQAATMGTSLAAMNMPHTLGTASPLSNIGDILRRGWECAEAEREQCIAAEAIARRVGKLLGEMRLQAGVAGGVIRCGSPKRLLTQILSL